MNLAATLQLHARSRPDEICIVSIDNRVSYRELWHVCQALATEMRQRTRSGDRVLVAFANSWHFVAGYMGALAAGRIPVPVNSRWSPAQLQAVLHNAEPAMTFGADWFRETLSQLDPTIPYVDETRLEAIKASTPLNEADFTCAPAEDAAPAALMYTAGSSGAPKAVVHHHGQLRTRGMYLTELCRLSSHDTIAAISPMFHVSGQSMWLAALASGAKLLTIDRWSAEDFVTLARQNSVTVTHLISTLLTEVIECAGRFARPAIPSLRVVLTGGAFVGEDTLRSFEDSVGGRPIQGYGRTEGTVTWESPDSDEPFLSHGTIRPDVCNVRVIRRFETNYEELAPGEAGELVLKGDGLSRQYWRNPGANAESFTPDGWMLSGDLGSIDAAGRLHFLGRVDEMIKTGGENVYPSSVERTIRAITGVHDIAVASTPSSKWGQMVCAVIVLDTGHELTSVVERARAALAKFELPRRWIVVESIPRLPSHKADRLLVTALAESAAPHAGGVREVLDLD